MKKALFLSFSTLANATLLSLGFKCLLDLLALVMAVSLDGDSLIRFPRFVPFCICAGLAALLGMIAILWLNFKVSEKYGFTKRVWIAQYAGSFALAIPMLLPWEMLFDFLHKAF